MTNTEKQNSDMFVLYSVLATRFSVDAHVNMHSLKFTGDHERSMEFQQKAIALVETYLSDK
jgi:hypothetical protein